MTLEGRFFAALCFRTNPSTVIGGMDRCGFLFYAGRLAAGSVLLLVGLSPILLHHEFQLETSLQISTSVEILIIVTPVCGANRGRVYFRVH
jgi:hypothetical protein